MSSELLTQKEACERLGISAPTLRKAVNAGTVRTIILAKRRMVPSSEIERILAGR